MEIFRKILSVLTALLYVGVGLYLVFHPLANLLTVSWLLALSVLAGAITSLSFYFSLPKLLRDPGHLWRGILELICGIFLLSYGYISLPVLLPTLIAIWSLGLSVVSLVRSYRLKSILPRLSSSLLWAGIGLLVLGLVLFFHPLLASTFVAYLLALAFLYQGIAYLFESLRDFSKN